MQYVLSYIYTVLKDILKTYKRQAEDEPIFPHIVYEVTNTIDDESGYKEMLNITLHSKNENEIEGYIHLIDDALKAKNNKSGAVFYVRRMTVFRIPMPKDEDVYRERLQYYIKIFG